MGDLQLNQCIIYLDDIVVFTTTPKEYLTTLRKVFMKLKIAELKLRPSKCKFFKKFITYLGHVVSENGVEADPTKTPAIRGCPTPVTVTNVRSFLGLTKYYWRFIKDYTQVAHPLYALI